MTSVIFASMPFAAPSMPSLGLSLLKQILREQGIESRIFYFSLSLAERIGLQNYLQIATGFPDALAVVGEWVFGGCLNHNDDDTSSYWREVFRAKHLSVSAEEGRLGAFREMAQAVRELAPEFVEECAKEILDENPSVVGFTSVFQQHTASLAIAKTIKDRDPSITIVFGGANCEGVMGLETLKQFKFIDYVFSGEAEEGFASLVRAILLDEPRPFPPGMFYRDEAGAVEALTTVANPVRDLDTLPIPDFRDFADRVGRSPLAAEGLQPVYLFETARGCWWGQKIHCTFCGLNGLTMPFRSKSPERAFAEISHLHSLYPNCQLAAVDNIFDHRYFNTLLPKLRSISDGLDIFYEVKSNLNKSQLTRLAEAGIRKLMPGIESFLDDVLHLMGKGVRGIQNLQFLRWCDELDIEPSWCLLWGFPGEEPDSYDWLCELIPKITHLHPPLFYGPIRLDRFSPNFNEWQERGFRDVRPGRGYSYAYNLDDESLSRLAYYFEYAYADGHDPETYTAELAELVTAWQISSPRSRLSFTCRPQGSYIVDTREMARSRVFHLSQVQTVLMRAGDVATTLAGLSRHLEEEIACPLSDFAHELAPLVENGYMLEHDGTYLSLATKVALNF